MNKPERHQAHATNEWTLGNPAYYDADEMDAYLVELEMFRDMALEVSALQLEWAKKIASHRS